MNGTSLFHTLIAADSVWSVVIRAVIWFAIATIIIISTDRPGKNKRDTMQTLKANLGFFVLFVTVSGGLLYLLFGFTTV